MTTRRIILLIVALTGFMFSCIWYYYDQDFNPLLSILGTLLATLIILFEKKIKISYLLGRVIINKPKIPDRIRLVAFDVDGVLIVNRHFMYSWQKVWEYLKLSDKQRKELLHKYRDLQEITYPQWCKECELIFKGKELEYSDFEQITAKVKQIRNLENALYLLREKGIKTAIISGGIDVFLAHVIPNYQNLFDYVFINKMTFDAKQRLESIIPTPYDFKMKFDALVEIGKKESLELNQMVFVGEGMNDFDAMVEMRKNGVTLFSIKPHDANILDIAYVVSSYNLLKIVKLIVKAQ